MILLSECPAVKGACSSKRTKPLESQLKHTTHAVRFRTPCGGGKNKAPRSESAAPCRSPVHFTGSPGPNPVCGNFRLLVLPGSPRNASSLGPGTSERRLQAFSVEAKTRVPKEKYII